MKLPLYTALAATLMMTAGAAQAGSILEFSGSIPHRSSSIVALGEPEPETSSIPETGKPSPELAETIPEAVRTFASTDADKPSLVELSYPAPSVAEAGPTPGDVQKREATIWIPAEDEMIGGPEFVAKPAGEMEDAGAVGMADSGKPAVDSTITTSAAEPKMPVNERPFSVEDLRR